MDWRKINDGEKVELGLIQIDIVGHSQLRGTERSLSEVKQIFRSAVEAIAIARGGKMFNWGGDGGSFMFAIKGGEGCTSMGFAAIQMLYSMPAINEEISIRTGLETALHVRVSADCGIVTYHKDPTQISADFINSFLHNEKSLGVPEAIVLTERVWNEIVQPLRTRFQRLRHSDEVGCDLYALNTGVKQQPQDEIDLVRRQCQEQIELAHQQCQDAINLATLQSNDRFIEQSSSLHTFEHNARNLCVKLMPRKPFPVTVPPGGLVVPITGTSHTHYIGDFASLLHSVADIFQRVVPPEAKVWACLRERRSDDKYYTWVRSTGCNPTRQEFSEPVHKDSKTIQNLRYAYEVLKDCVIITGVGCEDWHPVANDGLGENQSVLMGAVLSKSFNPGGSPEFDDPKLNWLLCVNANKPKVFDRSHIPLMKACNDTFSWILNSFIRYDAELNNWPSRPPGIKESTV